MEKYNRNLLVLLNENTRLRTLDHEVELLHHLLFSLETSDHLLIAHEVINVNKYKIYTDTHSVRRTIKHKDLKPFVFLINKN